MRQGRRAEEGFLIFVQINRQVGLFILFFPPLCFLVLAQTLCSNFSGLEWLQNSEGYKLLRSSVLSRSRIIHSSQSLLTTLWILYWQPIITRCSTLFFPLWTVSLGEKCNSTLSRVERFFFVVKKLTSDRNVFLLKEAIRHTRSSWSN